MNEAGSKCFHQVPCTPSSKLLVYSDETWEGASSEQRQ